MKKLQIKVLGQPATGKSQIAAQIYKILKDNGIEVNLIDELDAETKEKHLEKHLVNSKHLEGLKQQDLEVEIETHFLQRQAKVVFQEKPLKKKVEVSTGEYADHLVDSAIEQEKAETLKIEMVSPITVESASIEMLDEYNGNIAIKLSNGDVIRYNCFEFRSKTSGPEIQIEVRVNHEKLYDSSIHDYDFLDYYFTGSWIVTLCNFYKDKYLTIR